MKKATNIEFKQLLKHARPDQKFNDELLLIKLEDIDMQQANMEVLPVLLEGYSAIIVTKGEATITIDYTPFNIKKGMVLELVHNAIQNFSISQNFEGYHLMIAREFFLSTMRTSPPPPANVVNFLRLNPITQPTDNDFRILVDTIERLQADILKTGHYYQHDIIVNEIKNFIMELRNIGIKKYGDTLPNLEHGKYEELMKNFVKLILQHCKEKHDVMFYSTELCVTPVYLSRVAKMFSGKTAIKWISEALIIEAKLMLRNPNVSIQKVAEELNFSDQSSFGKFFKKHTGMSPAEHRQNTTIKQAQERHLAYSEE